MAGVTDASSPQSAWLEELADVDFDWNSISPRSTPTPGTAVVSPSTGDVAEIPHSVRTAWSRPVSSSSTEGDTFHRTAEGDGFSSTPGTLTLGSTATLSPSRPGSSSTASSLQTPKRIIRGSFPPALKSNSPIPGLTSSPCLRTLFCLGEALNVGCQAARESQDVLLELYCRVMSSYREGNVHHFVLADLTHDNPPFINATFAS